MSKRYKIIVYARRGFQPCYHYTQFQAVKASKLDDVLAKVAIDVYVHETRSGMRGYISDQYKNGIIVIVGINKFIVKGWPL